MSTAMEKIFSTAELLEMILLYIHTEEDNAPSMRALLLTQRVSTHFRAIIQDSPTFRRILWFEDSPTRKKGLNPLIATTTQSGEHCVLWFEDAPGPRERWHPLIVPHAGGCATRPTDPNKRRRFGCFVHLDPRTFVDEASGEVRVQSWQKMMINKDAGKWLQVSVEGKDARFCFCGSGDVFGAQVLKGTLLEMGVAQGTMVESKASG